MSQREPNGGGEYTPEPPPIYRPSGNEQPTVFLPEQPTVEPFDQAMKNILDQLSPTPAPPAAVAAAPARPAAPPERAQAVPPSLAPPSPDEQQTLYVATEPGVYAGQGEPAFPPEPYQQHLAPSSYPIPPSSTPPMMSGLPVTGYGPERPGRSKVVPVLSVICVVMFLVAAVMTGLYANAGAAKARDAALDKKVSELTGQLAATRTDLEAARKSLTTAQGAAADATEQNKVLAKCLKLENQFLTQIANGDKPGAQVTLDAMRQPCNQAEPFLSPS